ncbi:hypothetical protein KJI95_00110 [Shewanella sp. JM162201]|uniref:Porin n=1 Tax=Shewanella jiangmenensis TaxID=2837387 RepID=A0ABS5UZK8_9GAMM|nr:OprO/OprP family phosphate-selective porin [Shewanella jiangmenensis]MBT1442931.1 hypothetical protein [Shewanella jiangmenensis]
MKPSLVALMVSAALVLPGQALAELGDARAEQLAKELAALKAMKAELDAKSREFEQRIETLEAEVSEASPEAATLIAADAAANSAAASAAPAPVKQTKPAAKPEKGESGVFEPGKGFVIARDSMGELDISAFTYVRYLNQDGFDDTYTDSFGRTSTLDLRNDLQFQKITLNFKGWIFDPKFRYLMYAWTSNTSQGDPAQVVLGGNLGYQFDPAFNLYAGIGALPSTRSTNYTFPTWLKNDHRTIADEFFRGSYTSGIWANGKLAEGVEYRAMIGNNLSQLGVNAAQMDGEFNTLSGALWWMPTTGEYGPGQGLGDYEHHDEFATLFGVHFTRSREDAQGQPGTEGFENSQLRLSDGTLIFRTDPFMTGGDIRKATYQMAAINGGFKYKGWSLEAEAYQRWLDDFVTTGPIPVNSVEDSGFQIQGSAMVIPNRLQAYAGYSQIFGDYGDPYDVSLGVNYYPLDRRELRLNMQALYLNDSPVGYSSVPFQVGANGWAFTTDVVLAF